MAKIKSDNNKILNRVLAVDDSKSVLNLLCAHLEQIKDIEYVKAVNYAETKALLEQQNDNPFLCAILDLNLPDAQNGEVVALVQKYNIPSIILTSSIDKAIKQTITAQLVLDYVTKNNVNSIEYIANEVEHIYKNQQDKVLVVDDSVSYRNYLSVLINNLRYQVLFAEDGIEALEVLEKNTDISLIIADYHMPNMDGMQLVEEVRKNYKKQDLAILGLSSHSDKELIIKWLKMGASDYMAKPIVPEEFYCRVTHNVNSVGYVREIKKSAATDYLTQTHNRMSLFEVGGMLYAHSQRESHLIAVAMIDADHFKQINDTYGHDIGDKVLVSLAATLKGNLRKSDMIARFGGEEFVCLAAVSKESEAMVLFEKMRLAVEANELEIGDKKISITVSIGVTTNPGKTFNDMIKKADKAVYQAKNNGRNQVVSL